MTLTKRHKWLIVTSFSAGALAVSTIALGSGPSWVRHVRKNAVTSVPERVRYAKSTHAIHETLRASAKPSPTDLLTALTSMLNPSPIVDAAIVSPPAGYRPTEDPSVAIPPDRQNELWVHYVVRVSGDDFAAVTRAMWTANLVTGALRDKMHDAGLPPLADGHMDLVFPSGKTFRNASGPIGYVAYDQIFSQDSASNTVDQIESNAIKAGLEVTSVDVLNVDQPAPAVEATTTDPQAFDQGADRILRQVFGPIGTYEGEYLAVRDNSGTLVFVQGSAFRSGAGQRWWNPDLFPDRRSHP